MSRWPFLVARGQRLGYRVVLGPDFLVQARQHNLLADHVGDGPISPGGQSVVELPSAEFGPLIVTYREEPAAAELGSDGETDTLRDRHGRPLELLYGVVTGTPPVPVDDTDMARARGAAIEAYRRFLADEEGTDVQPSPGFTPDAEPPQPRVPAIARQEQPGPARPTAPPAGRRGQKSIVIIATLLVVVLVVVVAVLVGGRLM